MNLTPAPRLAAEPDSESAALAHVARALSGAGTAPSESLRILCEHALQLVAAEGAAIALVVGAELRAEALAGSLTPFGELVVPLHGSMAEGALKERRTILANDVLASGVDSGLLRSMAVEQVLMTPLIVEDRPVGLLVTINSQRGGFTPDDASLVERLAAQGSLALHSALLSRRAERRAREARALAEIVRRINQSLELDRVLSLVARHATELLEAREARVAMIEGSDVVIVAAQGGEPMPGWRMPHAGDEASAGQAGAPARGTAQDETERDWRWTSTSASAPVLSVPLGVGQRVIGALRVLGAEGQQFDASDEELLLALADHAAIAIENARLYRASVRTMRHASILAASARSLALHTNPAVIYADVWRLARTSLGADGIGIYLVRGTEAAELTFSGGVGAERARTLIGHFHQTAGAEVVASGRPQFMELSSTESSDPLATAMHDVGVASVALLPLIVEGKPRGLLALRFRLQQGFEVEQQRFLLDFASHTAAAVRNALLIDDLEGQAAQLRHAVRAERREREEAEAAAAIARIAMRVQNVGTACAQILGAIENVIPSTASALALRRADGTLRYVACRGDAGPLLDQQVIEQPGPARRVTVAPVVAQKVLPLLAGDDLIGVVALSTGGEPDADRQRRSSLRRLAAPLSLALNALLLREEERRVAEQLRQSERLAALGELVAGVAHEVNNPLTGISAFAQLLQEEELTEEQLESVRLIKKESDRAVAVMRDLLTFARKAGPRLTAVDLNMLVEQTLRLRTYGLRTMGVDVQLELDPELCAVRGDERQLQQVLLNLVVNAEHAMSGQSERVLLIRTRNEEQTAIVEVRDTGCGMSAEVQRRVFEPFFTTKPDGRGTGLGLSVSYGIIRNLQGTLEVESAPGAGACFRFALPRLPSHEIVNTGPC